MQNKETNIGIQRTKEFLAFLKEKGTAELTIKYITKKFFNNNKGQASQYLKLIKDLKIVESSGSWKSKSITTHSRGQLWNYLGGEEKLENQTNIMNPKSISSVQKEYTKTFSYRNLYEVTITFTKEDNATALKLIESMADKIYEEGYIQNLTDYGFQKEKAWFYYNLYLNKRANN